MSRSASNEEVFVDASLEESRWRPISGDSIATLLYTTYLLLFVAFLKTLIDRVRPKKDAETPKQDPATLVENESLEEDSLIEYVEVNTKTNELDSDDEVGQYGLSLKMSKKLREPRKPQPSFIGFNTTIEDDFWSQPMDAYSRAVSDYYKPLLKPKAHVSLADSLLSLYEPKYLKPQDRVRELVAKQPLLVARIQPLTQDQLFQVELAWKRHLGTVISAYSIDVTVNDLKTLCDGRWLNDNVIDFYLCLVTEKNPQVYCWTTHFYTTLKDKGYQGVARWAKRRKINVFERRTVVVPINIMSTHWAVGVVDNEKRSIAYYDSLNSGGNLRAVETIEMYLQNEAKRLGVAVEPYELEPNKQTPQQQNGYDCGVFTCTVARSVCSGLPLQFGQGDMPVIRRRMAYEIMRKTLLAA